MIQPSRIWRFQVTTDISHSMNWENTVSNFLTYQYKLTKQLGTMMMLWTNTVNADKKVSIARVISFYEDYEKILIFVLETGEM